MTINRWVLFAGLTICATIVCITIYSNWLVGRALQKVGLEIGTITNPISIHDSVWIEELTWLDVRDLVKSGTTSVILPTGGIEQNGPFVATGKHNIVVELMSEKIARKLENTLIAPVVKFVPEGQHEPPSGHMLFPGTIGLTESTFEAVLLEICLSLKNHGFTDIFIIGDSGGNQAAQNRVAQKLNRKWAAQGISVHHVESYYSFDKWGYMQLKELGVFQQPDIQSAKRGKVHSDFYYESILATADPELIRASERRQIGQFIINDVSLDPIDKTVEIGQALIEQRTELIANEIKAILSQ